MPDTQPKGVVSGTLDDQLHKCSSSKAVSVCFPMLHKCRQQDTLLTKGCRMIKVSSTAAAVCQALQASLAIAKGHCDGRGAATGEAP